MRVTTDKQRPHTLLPTYPVQPGHLPSASAYSVQSNSVSGLGGGQVMVGSLGTPPGVSVRGRPTPQEPRRPSRGSNLLRCVTAALADGFFWEASRKSDPLANRAGSWGGRGTEVYFGWMDELVMQLGDC